MKKMNNISTVNNCFGCGICSVKCPHKAIEMGYNSLGQQFPKIDSRSCIECGLCINACPALNNKKIQNIYQKKAYIAVNCDQESLMKSASGGVSAALAKRWIEEGGYVCGASGVISQNASRFHVEHIIIHSIQDIKKIQGSKYVQSDITKAMPEIEKLLKGGRKVLFFGTSCQVAAVKSFLKKKYDSFSSCDLICHGVIGSQMFDRYLQYIEKRESKKLLDVSFRTKEQLPPYNFTFTFTDDNGTTYQKKIDKNRSCYYRMFLGCIGYRKSCYQCPYACIDKPSDITLGDYYEAEEDYPELFETGKLIMKKGVSSVVVHSQGGVSLLNSCSNELDRYPVEVDKVVRSHAQLQQPSKAKKGSDFILFIYRILGWPGVDLFYKCFDFIVSKIRLFLKR